MEFIGRKRELETLEREYSNNSSSFIVIYGRRRIGKTRLIEEFIKNKKDTIYYLASDEKDYLQIKEIKLSLGQFLNDDFLSKNDFSDWKSLFSYLEKVWPIGKKIVLVVDEVTFVIKNNHSFTSYLQQFWDSFLSKTKTKLILNGSLVGLMLKTVLSGESPLYGRRTGELFLEELKFHEVKEFLKKDNEEAIKFFSILGGVPKYLELVRGNFNNLLEDLFDKRSFFYREGIYLMTEEFNDISTYSNILRAIAEGKNKLNEISEYCKIDGRKISAYLSILENIGFIIESIPATKKDKKYRGTNYLIKDSFLEFWFKFINNNRSLIEFDKGEIVIKNNLNNINSFIGRKFERVCLEFINNLNRFEFTRLGNEWGKIPGNDETYEIDILALNADKQEALFTECKWSYLNYSEAKKVLEALKEKSKYVDWQKKKEYFCIMAKKIKEKEKLRKEGYLAFDLDDFD